MEKTEESKIRIEASLISDVYFLPEVVEEYSKIQNHTKIVENRVNSESALKHLEDGKCDIAVTPRLANKHYEQFDQISMGTDTLTFVVPLGHALSKKKTVFREDICQCLRENLYTKFLMREEGSATREQIFEYIGVENRKLLESKILPKRCYTNEEVLSLVSMSNSAEIMLISIVSSKLTEHLRPHYGKVIQINDIGEPREFLMLRKKNNTKMGVNNFWEFAQTEFNTKRRLHEVAKILENKIRSSPELSSEINLDDNHQVYFNYCCQEETIYLNAHVGHRIEERANDVKYRKSLKQIRFGMLSVRRRFHEEITVKCLELMGDYGEVAERIFQILKAQERNSKKIKSTGLYLAGTASGIIATLVAAIILKLI